MEYGYRKGKRLRFSATNVVDPGAVYGKGPSVCSASPDFTPGKIRKDDCLYAIQKLASACKFDPS